MWIKGTPRIRHLTPSNYAVLRIYKDFVNMHGYGPRPAELGEPIGVHENTIRRHLKKLESIGYLTKTNIPQLRWVVNYENLKNITVNISDNTSHVKDKYLHQIGMKYVVEDGLI